MDIEQIKSEFLHNFEQIKREGSDKLLDYICKSDFFTAPASTRFHSAFPGGLAFHTNNCYKRFKALVELEYGKEYEKTISDESIAIIALLHDICKIDFYKEDVRNVKVDGVWEQQPYYSVDDKLPFGHGEKSVYIASAFIKLTREEAMAINWHMGGFDPRVIAGQSGMVQAFYRYPICTLFYLADVAATYLDEDRK